MKEATGEVSMTIVTLVAIAVIGAILATQWDNIATYIDNLWTNTDTGTRGEEVGEHGGWAGGAGEADG